MTIHSPPADTADPMAVGGQTVRIAAFSCDGLADVSRVLGFPVAVVAAVDDVERHARRLHELWRASGVVGNPRAPTVPSSPDDRAYRDWWPVRFDARWLGSWDRLPCLCLNDGTLLLRLPAGVDREAYAAAFAGELAGVRPEAIARDPSLPVDGREAPRLPPPLPRDAHASADDPTATGIEDRIRSTAKGLAEVADIALGTMERLARAPGAGTHAVHRL